MEASLGIRGNKQKGKRWEREAAADLSVQGGEWRRIPGSGSIGTQLRDSTLTGDLVGRYPWFKKAFKGESKTGYGSPNQLQMKREWFTKIREEAEADNKYPVVVIKFSGVTSGDLGSAKIVAFNLDIWNKMMEDLNILYQEHLKLLERDFKLKGLEQ